MSPFSKVIVRFPAKIANSVHVEQISRCSVGVIED